ncbi:hypothetical protein H1R20_g509, partial [Candolleomyces eurysporus]
MSDTNLRKRTTTLTGDEGQLQYADRTGDEDRGAKQPKFGRSSPVVRWLLVAATTACVGLWFLGPGLYGPPQWQAIPAKDSRIQTNYTADEPKRDAIVAAFRHAWEAYERDAMGADEYHPIARKGSNLTSSGGIGYFIIDTLDTMQLMGLTEYYTRARAWIASPAALSFDQDGKFNTFETTIRVLGGLLSAYHLSDEDPVFLQRAVDLADRLLAAFETPTGLPLPMVNLKQRKGVGEEYNQWMVSTAEAATLQLEFRYLSYLTDNEEYWYKAEKVMKVIKDAKTEMQLAPIYIGAQNGQFMMSDIRLGSRGDSYYEYLLKQYLQTDRTEEVYRQMYQESMDAARTTLIRKGVNKGNIYTFELIPERQAEGGLNWRLYPKQDHLVCFLGGSLMLGAVRSRAFVDKVSVPPHADELSDIGKSDWALGYELIETCMDTYDSPTGLSPEIAHFYIEDDGRDWSENAGHDWYVKGMEFPGNPPSYDARYILRPETVESLFIAFRLTGDQRYRDYGWKIFQAIERNCKIESGGYASILDVMNKESEKEDKMETFFLSETLKYLYLLFSDSSVLPLDPADYDSGLFTPLEDLHILSETQYTTLKHPAFPRHGVRIKKTKFCDGSVNSYTGYIDVEARHLFFYFFESRNDPDKDDVILWTNGGPGASSSLGLFMELGPCRVLDENGPKFHPESWNSRANIFFIDQPVSVGFSYAEYGEHVGTTEEAAKDIAAFVHVFFEHFTKFKGRPFHMAGESYGGRYIPVFASYVYDQNQKLEEAGLTPINLASVMIGNGLTDFYTMATSYYDMACTPVSAPPVLDITTCVRMKQAVEFILLYQLYFDTYNWRCCQAALAFCGNEISTPFSLSGKNPYDISRDCEGEITETFCYPVTKHISEYLDRPDVRKKIGVDSSIKSNFSSVSWELNNEFFLNMDEFRPTYLYISALLERGVRALIYVGANDWICNHVGNERWTLDLEWSGQQNFSSQPLRDWYVDGKRAGRTRGSGGLTFATIDGAGHMVRNNLIILVLWR